ncbi:KTSC domain-containing protein [Moritella sp. 24]|uniref:KTSC domain-containing protein n=1 Tax=Moritella sp. 24 TaxID=2746230 RepID=UPI001BA710E6|nr:KTSC domain-containing protein [Moritella sp. 24]QUM75525.1 KTSC domain-containing protein [Moritella sp. 24]
MERQLVESSNLVSVGYDHDSSTLEIEFRRSTYQYFDVPHYIYEELMNSGSKGAFHHQNIKTAYSFAQI